MKTSVKLLLLGLLLAFVTIPGVYATWTYCLDDVQDKNVSVGVQINEFSYHSEVVITKITHVSSTVTSQSSNYIQPTEVRSTITGSAGQKIVYKIDAHNYSKTDSFVYAGTDYNSGIYENLNKISISVSLDEQGSNLINTNLSANAHRGTKIAPNEDFVFYITYTLTGDISAGEILVDYTFKPVIYTVTYLHNNQTFAVEHITDNQSTYSVIAEKPTQSGVSFAGWINANAVVVNTIPANNTHNYTLSASWDKIYLIIFADAQGNVLYQEQITSSSTSLSPQGQATVDQILADLNAEAKQSDMKVSWSDYEIKNVKEDITVKAIYAYNGVLNLVPVYEQPDDGIVDYYQVEAVDSLPETVIIPGNVGGVPVKTVIRVANTEGASDWNNYASNVTTIIIEEGVENLQIEGDDKVNTNALAYTPSLKLVKLPSTLKYIGKNTFSRNYGDDKKVITIEFNGTKAEWKAIEKHKDWDNGLKTGTIVQCTDGYFSLTTREVLGITLSKSWKEY
ncbi:MAG: hypothetical protein E7348_01025 [Clostridiales bacterium]|nr:hypothetical protein [Clostridiales bacterium]